jgi:hypothetical protein
MDTANSFFPMDLGAMPMQTDSMNGLQADGQTSPPQGGHANALSGNGAAFLGVSEPPVSQLVLFNDHTGHSRRKNFIG